MASEQGHAGHRGVIFKLRAHWLRRWFGYRMQVGVQCKQFSPKIPILIPLKYLHTVQHDRVVPPFTSFFLTIFLCFFRHVSEMRTTTGNARHEQEKISHYSQTMLNIPHHFWERSTSNLSSWTLARRTRYRSEISSAQNKNKLRCLGRRSTRVQERGVHPWGRCIKMNAVYFFFLRIQTSLHGISRYICILIRLDRQAERKETSGWLAYR